MNFASDWIHETFSDSFHWLQLTGLHRQRLGDDVAHAAHNTECEKGNGHWKPKTAAMKNQLAKAEPNKEHLPSTGFRFINDLY